MTDLDVPPVQPPQSIGLFATQEGIRAVESPVRVKILSLLRERELSFHEVVVLTGKAKSTVSAHLRALLQEGVIGEKPDLADSRRKKFYIKSRFLGDITAGARIEDEEEARLIEAFVGESDPRLFYKLMFRSIRVSLMSQGINIDPILREAGYRIGKGVYAATKDPDVNVMVRNVMNFWERHNLGHIVVENYSPVTLVVYDCFECGELPHTGKPACAFDAGILEAVFSGFYKTDHKVTELRCYAMGDDQCKFVIRPVDTVN